MSLRQHSESGLRVRNDMIKVANAYITTKIRSFLSTPLPNTGTTQSDRFPATTFSLFALGVLPLAISLIIIGLP